MKLQSHGRYDYSAISQRKDYSWPAGKRLAVHFCLNVEHFSFGEGLGNDYAAPHPQPNTRSFAWRDYGNRVGAWRLLELAEAYDLPYALLVNSELYGYWHIDDDSWLHDLLTGRERWLVMRYELVDPNSRASRQPAQVALVSQAMHVIARFPNPTWSESLPSRTETQRMFSKGRTINSLELGSASVPFADSELPLESPVETCKRK